MEEMGEECAYSIRVMHKQINIRVCCHMNAAVFHHVVLILSDYWQKSYLLKTYFCVNHNIKVIWIKISKAQITKEIHPNSLTEVRGSNDII